MLGRGGRRGSAHSHTVRAGTLKILSFVKMAGKSRKATFQYGFAFFSGIIVSFWILASAMLLLQSYGHAVGWGFQFQEPIFVALMTALLLLLGLSFFGVFEIGTSLTAMAGQAQQITKSNRGTLISSFLGGMLATAIATPCSAPYLASAMGFTMALGKCLLRRREARPRRQPEPFRLHDPGQVECQQSAAADIAQRSTLRSRPGSISSSRATCGSRAS